MKAYRISLNFLLAFAMVVVFYLTTAAEDQLVVGNEGGTVETTNVPKWKPSYAKHGCVKKQTEIFHPEVLVITVGGDLVKMDTLLAMVPAETSSKADDVWVVGFC